MPDKNQPKVEFFFDCSSPWTYLAFVQMQGVIERTGLDVEWKPILVGGVFNAVNDSVYTARANPHPVKGRYYVKDLRDWARYAGIKIGNPPVFPVKSVRAMRAAFYAQAEGKLYPYCLAVFESYWGDLNDINEWEFIRAAAEKAGLDPDKLQAYAESPEAKKLLIDTTQELIDRGGFGSPTIFVNGDDMYFGNDRLPLVEDAINRAKSA